VNESFILKESCPHHDRQEVSNIYRSKSATWS